MTIYGQETSYYKYKPDVELVAVTVQVPLLAVVALDQTCVFCVDDCRQTRHTVLDRTQSLTPMRF